MRRLAEGGIVPSLRVTFQHKYKITNQDLEELAAQGPLGSHQCGPPSGEPLNGGPPHGRGNGGGAEVAVHLTVVVVAGVATVLAAVLAVAILYQNGLRRQMDLLGEDAHQHTEGRNIQKVRHTNKMRTVYEMADPIKVHTSSCISNP